MTFYATHCCREICPSCLRKRVLKKAGGMQRGKALPPLFGFGATHSIITVREKPKYSRSDLKSRNHSNLCKVEPPLQRPFCKESFLPFSKGKNYASGAISPLICGGCLRNALVMNARYPRPIAPQTKPRVIELDSRFSHNAPTVSAPITGRIR